MKERVLTLIIGVLIGAIIASCIFLVINGNSTPKEETNEIIENNTIIQS